MAIEHVIGFDPGLARLGVAVLRCEGQQLSLVTATTITTPAKSDPQTRLRTLYEAAADVLAEYSPSRVGIEQLFFQKNVTTALSVSEARGVVRLACAQKNIPLVEFTPSSIKRTVTGSGNATKPAMEKMMKLVLRLAAIPKDDDAADAMAIAVCAALHQPPSRLLDLTRRPR